jgi:hypothetical protein
MDPLLMDDPALVAEIQKLDLPDTSPDDERFNMRRTLVEWAEEEGLVLSPPDDSIGVSPYAPAMPAAVPVPAPHGAMTGVTFVALMCVGAGTAALVFYDRVARILATL